ncbi:MAG TPA: PKD domain-containing protein, partial [Desulfobacterales bacterium]|nr:PKD domain-containing protein [Desulfobacterales bacterium]
IQAACNQCAPAAVANSLQYLENTFPKIKIPHENKKGLKGDDTLVGQLDTAMGRQVENRMKGRGVWPLEGKLRYLDQNNLGQVIKVKYQGTADPGSNAVGRVTAKNMGKVSFEFIVDEICSREDVELVLRYPNNGAHAVELTCAGYICGIPFIRHLSDLQQTCQGDPQDKLGCDRTCQSFLVDDGKGNLTVVGPSHDPVGTRIEMVYSQSPNEPPKKPDKPVGPTKVMRGESKTYETNPATDPDGDKVQEYEWDFDGDGKADKVTDKPIVTNTWSKKGTYGVRVRARDEYGAVSKWSDALTVNVLAKIKIIGLGLIPAANEQGLAMFAVVASLPDQKGKLIYRDRAAKVNVRSINVEWFWPGPPAVILEGEAKGKVGNREVARYRVYLEDNDGAGADFFRIMLFDKNGKLIYMNEGLLRRGNIWIE